MPRPRKGKRLGGDPAHQKAMLANLAQSLIWDEQITTTLTRAKVLRPYVE
ncbi:MAG: 50S ribosomal protein L17, partial [bacterium]|nr:50S ribosomal protein L17 [bacterium]